MRFFMRATALSAALLLFGCASLKPQQYSSPVEVMHWELDGKLGIRAQGKAQSAFFNWQNHPDHFTISVHGPLGQGRSTLEEHLDGGVELRYDGNTYFAATPEKLMQRHLGWSFPIDNMRWWARGLPAPDSPIDNSQHGPTGELLSLSQAGWEIQYLRYQTVNGLSLPYKIAATRDDLQLTLLLKKWELQSQ